MSVNSIVTVPGGRLAEGRAPASLPPWGSGWRQPSRGPVVGQDVRVTDPLISAARLREVLGEVTVLDVRYRWVARPGAASTRRPTSRGRRTSTSTSTSPTAPGERGRRPPPDPVDSRRRCGVRVSGMTRTVVVYDDWQGRAAAAPGGCCGFHGHPDVRVLDGGWTAWRGAGGESRRRPAPVAGDFTAAAGTCRWSTPTPCGTRTCSSTPAHRSVTAARSTRRPGGRPDPGAVNVPTTANVGPDGRFRSGRGAARGLRRRRGDRRRRVAAYCGSGVTAAHDVLAMEVAGVQRRALPGSWSEWVTDPDRPVETG